MTLEIRLAGHVQERAALIVAGAVADRLASQVQAKNPTLWGAEATEEAAIRLGWAERPSGANELVVEVANLRGQLVDAGMGRVILCGMGGSSLAPEVMAAIEAAPLEILDSTYPAEVARITQGDLRDAVTVVSSKSGGTVETDSQRRALEAAYRAQGIDPSQRMVVVTDPDTALHHLARDAGYRVFLGNLHIGGRFSALSAFGLVPAGLAGVDIASLVEQADRAWSTVVQDSPDNPALLLAAALAAGYPDVNKLLLSNQPGVPGFGDWVEQLVAESTGKNGRGILPVVGSGLSAGADCLRIGPLGSASDIELGGGFGELSVVWMFATAFACRFIGVNPFDQPNVESAKQAARLFLEGGAPGHDAGETSLHDGSVWSANYPHPPATSSAGALGAVRGLVGSHGYLALCVFGDRGAHESWERCRSQLEASLQRPVTLGFGPRFLHSTGQFHKGGPAEGLFVQIVQTPESDIEVPGRPFSFGELIQAQARGDRQVLAETGQPVISITVPSAGIPGLQEALSHL